MIKRGATHDNPTPWIHGVMQIFALFMFLGMLTSFLVPESKRARLEELAGEEEEVYEVQGPWRNRHDVEAPRASGSGGSGRSTEGFWSRVDKKNGKWWRAKHVEVRQP
jgi:PHS family inorganic phosphate transporter-like MFS transporter